MLITEHAAFILLIALALDGWLGEPAWLWQRLPHPIVLMGRLISVSDEYFNHESDADWRRSGYGIVVLACWIIIVIVLGLAVSWLSSILPLFTIFEIILVAILLAQRSLYEHVNAVRLAFEQTGIAGAREAVAKIVGRDPDILDTSAICRASIESTAENFSDGIVAPAFWYLVAGLPGILAYKMINTADSMIAHRTPRHAAFGWAAARLDDLVNLAPARLAAVFIVIAAPCLGFSGYNAVQSVHRDARKHRSPNAGWPEAAMAGALEIALAGPRVYGTEMVMDAWMNDGGRDNVIPSDITHALRLMIAASLVMTSTIVVIAVLDFIALK